MASPSLDDMPIPVWPCEVLEGDVHAEMLARVAEAVREKDAELARQAAAKGSERHTSERRDARKCGERRDPRSAGEMRNPQKKGDHRDAVRCRSP